MFKSILINRISLIFLTFFVVLTNSHIESNEETLLEGIVVK